MKEKIDLIEAKKDYAELTKLQHCPRVKLKNENEEQVDPKMVSLSFEERRDMGNHYLQEVKKMVRKIISARPKQLSPFII